MTAATASSIPPETRGSDEHRGGSRAGHALLAITRVGVGFVFLWAFLDKFFGLGYATPAERSVLAGGSPSQGFLGNVSTGPFIEVFHAMAGAVWVDVLFMAALLGIGIALIAGAGLRIAAVAIIPLMLGMWLAEWPPARVDVFGEPTGSSNPFFDYHLTYLLLGLVFATLGVASRYGLGRWWSGLGFVRANPWLL